MIDLSGKVAVVTGAARGLGKQLSADLAGLGMRVAGLDQSGIDVETSMLEVARGSGVETSALSVDVGNEDQVQDAVKTILSRFGQIDVLINNAGIRGVAPVWATSSALWDSILSSNLKGQFLCTRGVLRQHMLDRGEGRLIFVSSLAGLRSVRNASAYCASKWGVRGLAASTALELKHTAIRVTCVLPGMILTPMARESEVWELGLNWLDPVHVSRAILFCLQQDPDTVIPELTLHHRAQIG